MHNSNIKKISFFIFFLASLILYVSPAFSAGGPPAPTGAPCWPPPCDPIPIDGGIGFLVAAGVALGGKKINDSLKKKTT